MTARTTATDKPTTTELIAFLQKVEQEHGVCPVGVTTTLTGAAHRHSLENDYQFKESHTSTLIHTFEVDTDKKGVMTVWLCGVVSEVSDDEEEDEKE